MKTHNITNKSPQTISWYKGHLIDHLSAGTIHHPDGSTEQLHQYHFGGDFDTAISSEDGTYAFVYKRLGTKGLLLKNGHLLREINRSYYHAETYEYPAVFFTHNGSTYLAHCPKEYCRIDFEDVETGEIITDLPQRKPKDIFHSRLEISPDGKHFVSKGWHWHPLDVVELFDIEACIADPCKLDSGNRVPENNTEICTATFIDRDHLLVGTSNELVYDDEEPDCIPPKHIAIWNFKEDTVTNVVAVTEPFGNLFAIDDQYCWDLFDYPKIIRIATGEIVEKDERISTGKQASSIIGYISKGLPSIAVDRQTRRIVVSDGKRIVILDHE